MTNRELRQRRERLGLTQAQVAAMLGVASITLSRWERGVARIPETAARLLAVLTPTPTGKRGGKRKRQR